MNTPVFVWREGEPPTHNMRGLCRYCFAETTAHDIDDPNDQAMDSELLSHWRTSYGVPRDHPGYAHGGCRRSTCSRCGWWINYASYITGPYRTLNAVLRHFDINDSQLAIPEICSHLARRFSDVYSVSPQRFEEVVAHVYREMGWEVVLTPETRDGGVDLYCLRHVTGETCIVECKRYSTGRRVGIFAVDRLLGVTIRTAAASRTSCDFQHVFGSCEGGGCRSFGAWNHVAASRRSCPAEAAQRLLGPHHNAAGPERDIR